MADGAIDQEPSAALPLPVWRGSGFLGEAVVDPVGAADYEQAVGYVVSGAKSELLDASVNQEWSNFQGERFVAWCAGAGIGEELDCGPFTESDGVRFGGGGSARLNDQGEQRYPDTRLRDADHGRGYAGNSGQDKVRGHKSCALVLKWERCWTTFGVQDLTTHLARGSARRV